MGFTSVDNSGFKDMINQIKDNTDKLKKSPAQRLQDKSHIYSTFYNVNMDHSTVHQGTEDIQDDIGPDSPMRYDKIENCLMFGLNDWDPTSDDVDYKGISIENENVSVIPADTFKPYEGSFFSLEIQDHSILYKIFKVERTLLENIPMYKIEYEPAVHSDEPEYNEIEDQIINEYQLLTDNIGTEAKSIVLNSELTQLEDIKKLTESINSILFDKFYDTRSKSYILDEGSELFYSPFVIEFLKTTNTLYHPKYGNKVMLSHELLKDNNFEYYFQNSIYVDVMKQEYPELNDYRFSMINIPDTSYEFSFTSLSQYIDRNLYSIDKNKVVLDNFDKIKELQTTDEEYEGFVIIINDYELTMDSFEEIWKTLEINDIQDKLTKVDEFLDYYINNGEPDFDLLDTKDIFETDTIDYYMKLPLVLFICRYYYNNQIGKSLVGYNTLFSNKIL
jgi:hypothetical protein